MSDLKHVFPKVPIIGSQPREVTCHAFDGRAVVVCDCGSPTPIDIPSFNRAGFCTACKQKFVIASMGLVNNGGHVTTEITIAKWAGPMSASRELEVGLLAEPETTRRM